MRIYNGIIVINKERGFTSHDVVAKLRGILRMKKIGHTGTLDPDAEGVLPVCLGNATKLSDIIMATHKEYIAKLTLGTSTDTQDARGRVIEELGISNVNESEVIRVINGYIGEYNQVPPMYSAIHHEGVRLYELARAGKVVDRIPRRVKISDIEILDISMPVITIRVNCSKGTYIRTLCADIGDSLGTGGHMSSLVRTASGEYRIEDSYTLDEIESHIMVDTIRDVILPVDYILREYRSIVVREDAKKLLENGNVIPKIYIESEDSYSDEEILRVYDKLGRFYGLYSWNMLLNSYKPYKMFL